jgi:predicted amidohydrolase
VIRVNLRIALLQLAGNGRDQDANLADGDAFCRKAAEAGADIALFPELWNIAYTKSPDEPLDALAGFALGPNSPFFGHFRALAKDLGIAIGLTYVERFEPQPRNSLSLIDRRGDTVLHYAKVHTCDFDWERRFTPGDGFYVGELDTAQGTVKVGAMICYDREFPESARVLMLRGAEIILTPNACEMDDLRYWQLASRAYENMVGVALANFAAPKSGGRSCAFSGIACNEDESMNDMTLMEAGPEEGVYIAEFDLDALRSYRERETWGNAFRKPYAYGPLVSPDVTEPFVREESRRDQPRGAR